MSPKKNIILLTQNLKGGGAENYISLIANYLAKLNLNIHLVLLDDALDHLLNSVSENVTIKKLGTKRARYSFFELKKYINYVKPSVILSNQRHINFLLVLISIFSIRKSKIIIREAAAPTIEIQQKIFIGSYLIKALIKILYPYADKIISPTADIKSDLVENYGLSPSKISVINNLIDYEKINNKSKVDQKSFTFDPKKEYIISVGRLVKQKNYQLLIRAFSKIKNKNVNLIIVGEGEEKNNLINLIKELNLTKNIFLLGYMANPYTLMKRSNLLVLSSIYEGIPNVVLEAAALGMPIIATDCPTGPRDILNNGEYGILVKNNDENELTKAIECGLDKKIKKIPYEIIKSKYGPSNIINLINMEFIE